MKHRSMLVAGEVKDNQCNVVAAKFTAVMKPMPWSIQAIFSKKLFEERAWDRD